MDLHFKPANVEDATLISQLAGRIWREHYPSIISTGQIEFMLRNRYTPQAIKDGMARGEKYFLAYAGNDPVAYADIELKGEAYFLHKFYVDVSRHRGGIGSRFFNYLLSQIDSSKPIRLQVNRQNYKAVNFYFRVGFVIESVGDFDIGGGYYMNDFIMLRRP